VRYRDPSLMDLEVSFVAGSYVVARCQIRLPPVAAQGLADAIETRCIGCGDFELE
jgi:hypothetical protein